VVADDCAETYSGWINSINPTIARSERLKFISFANVGCSVVMRSGTDEAKILSVLLRLCHIIAISFVLSQPHVVKRNVQPHNGSVVVQSSAAAQLMDSEHSQ